MGVFKYLVIILAAAAAGVAAALPRGDGPSPILTVDLSERKFSFIDGDAPKALRAIDKRCRKEEEGSPSGTRVAYAGCFMLRLKFEPKHLCNPTLRARFVDYTRKYFSVLETVRSRQRMIMGDPRTRMAIEVMRGFESSEGAVADRIAQPIMPDDRLMDALRSLAQLGALSLTDFSRWAKTDAPTDVVEMLGSIRAPDDMKCS